MSDSTRPALGPLASLLLAASGLACGLVPWAIYGWALPERDALSPLLEEVGAAFGAPLQFLFAELALLSGVVALVLGALVGASLLFWTRRRRFALALLGASVAIAGTQLLVIGLGVRELRAHTLPEGTASCACPEALESLERSVCACEGERVVAQIALEGGTRTTFEHDDAGAVRAFVLHGASGPLRSCTLEPPQPIDRIASAVLRCTVIEP